MTKYVFADKRWHWVTRFSVILVIAPYMLVRGRARRDLVLLALAFMLLAFDIYSVCSTRDDSDVHHYARAAALLVQAPYMTYVAAQDNDPTMAALTAAVLLADGVTFCLG